MGGSVSYGGGKWPSSRGYGRPSCLTDNEQGKGKVQLIFQVGLFESVKSGSIHRAIYISPYPEERPNLDVLGQTENKRGHVQDMMN